ncbi:MAG: putative inorganic carbon transporter subunit DabA [Polyangiales bacterium]
MQRFDGAARRRVLHDAYELHHQHEVLGALADLRARPVATPPAPRFQVAFCIDDREEGIRRHFEELDEAHETFGVAGFFGVAMRYEALDDRRPAPLCPAVVTPSHTIVERARAQQGSPAALRKSRQRQLGLLRREVADASRSLAAGAVFTSLVGALAVIPLTLRLVAPRLAWRMQNALLRRWLPAPETELALSRDEGDVAAAGFTLTERVERVAATLQNMGMLTRFGGLVALLGHGASTVNNPHHSAYDCGACGGRNGGPNARAFAAMANDPAVRERLRDKGIVIPEGTWFLGGVHDTTTDAVTLADEDAVPESLRGELAALRKSLDEARARSAHERCRRFAHAPARLTPAEALRHVEARAVDLAQPRPELGHVTNAITVVGRRALTRGLFLDRRALLVSYDPASDGEGRVLSRILGAVVPVCAGINLEYLFSTVDNDRWGSGTKLPHNLAALLGVMEGTRGDLRTGLPRQMIEIHEPVRLLLVVEATPARLRATLAGDPTVAELVERGWVRLVSIDPDDGAAQVYTDGVFAPWEHAIPRLPTVRSAMDHYSGRSENLPPVRISPSPEARS